jgi:SAM-dependent methyltransferase
VRAIATGVVTRARRNQLRKVCTSAATLGPLPPVPESRDTVDATTATGGRAVGRISFDNFGRLAAGSTDPAAVTMRYAMQLREERLILRDVLDKLEIGPDDDLLEIGCGPGTTLVPLAFLCASATGVDHEEVLRVLAGRFAGPPTITLLPGNFLDLALDRTYSRILVYSVVQYLDGVDEAIAFSLKAAELLAPGGRLLLGDLPNADRKRRFHASDAGKRFQEEWALRAGGDETEEAVGLLDDDQMIGSFDDASLVRLVLALRSAGFESQLLQQPPDLPFGFTREDVLITAPA